MYSPDPRILEEALVRDDAYYDPEHTTDTILLSLGSFLVIELESLFRRPRLLQASKHPVLNAFEPLSRTTCGRRRLPSVWAMIVRALTVIYKARGTHIVESG